MKPSVLVHLFYKRLVSWMGHDIDHITRYRCSAVRKKTAECVSNEFKRFLIRQVFFGEGSLMGHVEYSTALTESGVSGGNPRKHPSSPLPRRAR